ncbi:MAG: phosphopantetheine adenylyltransferase [Euryarchaeota archaeon]|nr:phosphopantetheine adenylyltransferase [Euryarchaeota archaeon]
MRKVAVGGTFDRIHRGHRTLLERAIQAGDHLVVGLTCDEMLSKPARPYHLRKASLEEFLEGTSHQIVPLRDPLGPAATMEDLHVLVVSEQTLPNAVKINEKREQAGLSPLEVIAVPMVLADDGRPISSTRIRKREIDPEGRVLDRGEEV